MARFFEYSFQWRNEHELNPVDYNAMQTGQVKVMTTAVMVLSPQDSLRFTIEKLLTNAGLHVCPGVSRLGAFRHALNACETSPDLILLDYWLGYAETIEFIQQLKRQGFMVILMGTKFLGRTLAAKEGIAFLAKPFTRQDLLQAI
jgi:DNA-binding NtrC family response regulator